MAYKRERKGEIKKGTRKSHQRFDDDISNTIKKILIRRIYIHLERLFFEAGVGRMHCSKNNRVASLMAGASNSPFTNFCFKVYNFGQRPKPLLFLSSWHRKITKNSHGLTHTLMYFFILDKLEWVQIKIFHAK